MTGFKTEKNTIKMSEKGKFNPRNPKKYLGDYTKIVYRSSWEKKYMLWLDRTKEVIEWSSEEVVIGYYNPVKKRMARYFPDFLVKIQDANGKIKIYLIEVKPKYQIDEPVKHGKVTRRYVNDVINYTINTAKWKAAKALCEQNGWEFITLDEHDLGIK